MDNIVIERFGGIAPVVPERSLAEHMATRAVNCKLRGGKLQAFGGHTPIYTPTKPGTILTIYRWGTSDDPETTGAVTAATQANPVQITSANHGLISGKRVYIHGVNGMTELNANVYTITVVDSNNFTLNGVDGTGYGAYTSGGTWRLMRGYWFHWAKDVDVVKGPVPGDTVERTYYTGDGVPKMTYAPKATASGDQFPDVSYDLGIPTPATAPTASVVTRGGNITNATQADPVVITSAAHGLDTDSEITIQNVGGMTELNGNNYVVTVLDADTFSLQDEDGNDVDGTGYGAYTSGGDWDARISTDPTDFESRAYVVAYVSALGEEGAVSEPSNIVDVGPNQYVELTNIAGAPSGNYNITDKRIYRTATGITGSDYLFLEELTIAPTSYTDKKTDNELGEALISGDWEPPPDDMSGLKEMPNGLMVGFSKNELCFPEPGAPHAWPVSYRRVTNHDIVAVEVIDQTVIVATKGNPYYATSVHPANTSMREIEVNHACISKRSMVRMDSVVIWASEDGLVAASPGGMPMVITEAYLDKKAWASYAPSTIHAYYYEGTYIAFYNNAVSQAGFVFDPKRPDDGLVELDFYATAGWRDRQEDALYLVIDGEVVRFDDDYANPLTYVWRSRRARMSRPTTLRAGQIYANDYPVTVKLYAMDPDTNTLVQKDNQSVTNQRPYSLPSEYLADEYEMELTGTVDVASAYAVQSKSHLSAR